MASKKIFDVTVEGDEFKLGLLTPDNEAECNQIKEDIALALLMLCKGINEANILSINEMMKIAVCSGIEEVKDFEA